MITLLLYIEVKIVLDWVKNIYVLDSEAWKIISFARDKQR